jgi:hypothetical protein
VDAVGVGVLATPCPAGPRTPAQHRGSTRSGTTAPGAAGADPLHPFTRCMRRAAGRAGWCQPFVPCMEILGEVPGRDHRCVGCMGAPIRGGAPASGASGRGHRPLGRMRDHDRGARSDLASTPCIADQHRPGCCPPGRRRHAHPDHRAEPLPRPQPDRARSAIRPVNICTVHGDLGTATGWDAGSAHSSLASALDVVPTRNGHRMRCRLRHSSGACLERGGAPRAGGNGEGRHGQVATGRSPRWGAAPGRGGRENPRSGARHE